MAPTRLLGDASATNPREVIKEMRVGFVGTLRVFDHDSFHTQSNQGQAHGHAMVVVGADLNALQRGGPDLESVRKFGDAGT